MPLTSSFATLSARGFRLATIPKSLPTFVSVGTAVSTSAGTIVVPLPSGVTQNMLLVIAFIANRSTSPSATGWTSIGTASANPNCVFLYKFAGASESSPTVTTPGNTTSAVMLAYNFVTGFDSVSGTARLTSSPGTSPAFTATADNDLVIAMSGVQSSATTFTTPSGVNPRYSGSAGQFAFTVVDKIQSTAGTVSAINMPYTPTSSTSTSLAAAFKN